MALFYRTLGLQGTFGGPSTEPPRWCDAFGPFELPWAPDSRTGVGPFLMKVKKRNKIKNNSVMLICEFERREGGCPAYAYVTQEGQLLGRRGLHNHTPLRDYPQCAPGSLNGLSSLPAPPTFAEASALLRDPRRRKQWFRQQPSAPAPATSMPIPDPDTGAMIETEITAANVLEISRYAEKRETINGEIRLACPVPGCKHVSKKGGIYKHLRMLHMNLPDRGSGDLSFCDEKLCPICKQDKVTHEDLIRHIVHDHDTRLECTEHEFESEEDFKKWKERTEQEEMSAFALRSGKNRAPLGTYICCRAGRKHRRSPLSRLLGFECPASMVVERRNNRLYVWFWRTHIGHRPAVVDVTLSSEDRLWVKECILNRMNNRDIILQGMGGYLGGNPRRVHLLDSQDIENIVRHFDLKELRGDIKSKHFKNEDLRKVRLARYIKRTMGSDKPMEAALNRAYHNQSQPKRSMVQDRLTGFYTVTGEEEADRGIVFPRRANHRECEHICDFCNICVHRYGCTCSAFMCDGLMCDHIHTVAMLAGAPGDEWLDPALRRETFGLDEALLRLARINYKERLEKMLPLLDEFARLVKADQHLIDLDKLQELLDSGIAMVKACPRPPLTLDDEAPADILATQKDPDIFDFTDDELSLPAPRSMGLGLKARPSGARPSSLSPLTATPTSAKTDPKLARAAGVAVSTTPAPGTTRALANIPRPTGQVQTGLGFSNEHIRPTYSRRANRLAAPVRLTRPATLGSAATLNTTARPAVASRAICPPTTTTKPLGVRIRLPVPLGPATKPSIVPTGTASVGLPISQPDGNANPPTLTSALPAAVGKGGALAMPTRLMVPLPQLLAAGLRPGSVAIIRKGPPPPGAVLVRGPVPPVLLNSRMPLSASVAKAIAPVDNVESGILRVDQATATLSTAPKIETTLTSANGTVAEEPERSRVALKLEANVTNEGAITENSLSATSQAEDERSDVVGGDRLPIEASQPERAVSVKRESHAEHEIPEKRAKLELEDQGIANGRISSPSWEQPRGGSSEMGVPVNNVGRPIRDEVTNTEPDATAGQRSTLDTHHQAPINVDISQASHSGEPLNTGELSEAFYTNLSRGSSQESGDSFSGSSSQDGSPEPASNRVPAAQLWTESHDTTSSSSWSTREQPVNQEALTSPKPWPERHLGSAPVESSLDTIAEKTRPVDDIGPNVAGVAPPETAQPPLPSHDIVHDTQQ
ncbi:hypothetical protein BIW11_10681 [Tropilaelaps mercedesae]|uniref:SWIM-type domain-containing protein n=1 Tax=Tropilaelaps mercedesae TaxID=418985 RepID=A0A1V9XEN1_9ACAR|nr:hypothetical protein BIW11_10681 [Tropilaelaps mercedesae]